MVNSLFINGGSSAGMLFLQSRYKYVTDTISDDQQYQLKTELLKFDKLENDALNNLLTFLDNVYAGNYSILENDSTNEVFKTIDIS